MAPGLRCGRSAIGDLQQIAKRVRMHFREPHENPFVFAIVIGDVVGFRITGYQLFAAIEGHLKDDRIEILAKPDDELSLNLQGRRAVRHAVFDIRKRERHLPDGVVIYLR